MIKPPNGPEDGDVDDRQDARFLARFKEFRATSVAVDHQTSVLVLFAFITIGGLLAYKAIPRESFPEIEIPMIAVNTIYPGVSPADIESLVTRPLEDELSTISDIKEFILDFGGGLLQHHRRIRDHGEPGRGSAEGP